MKTLLLTAVASIICIFGTPAKAQIYDTNADVVQTFAGSGFSGYVDGVGQLTMFNKPSLACFIPCGLLTTTRPCS